MSSVLKRILILAFFGLIAGRAIAQQEYQTATRFGIGFYAGGNIPLNALGKVSDIGPSFLVYTLYSLSPNWKMEIGLGGIFYNGKSLGYGDSKNIYDTVYAKTYTVTGVTYTSVPLIFKYTLSHNISIIIGARWLGVSSIYGSGSYGIYSPAHKDSFLYKSNISPNLPAGANFMDVQGLAGIEIAFPRHFSARLMLNAGFIPIYPGGLKNTISPLSGNNNNSIELGLNYDITPQ